MRSVGWLDEPHSVVDEVGTIERDLLVVLPLMSCRYVSDEVLRIGDARTKKANQHSFLLNLDFGEHALNAISDALMLGYPLGDRPFRPVKPDDPRSELLN